MAIDCVEFCKALAADTRQRILKMLVEEEEMSVSDIVDAFNVSQPTISHHLNVLRQFGLVTSRKEGKQVFYAINRDRVTECCGRLIAKFDVQEGVCEV
jgi:ArsR family transcriptional regulator